VTPTTSDRDYWEDRARRLGAAAAGYSDPSMDAYEDRLRADAIKRLVGDGRGRRLLDAGCGSGRWSVRLADAGWAVTGVDISPQLLALAPRDHGVTYIEAAMQDLDLPAASFDAWLSVTALQHITAATQFEGALDNLTRMLRPGGRAAVLEYAPLRVFGTMPDYIRPRDRGQWIASLTSRGYTKRAETGVRFIGHVPYMLTRRAFRHLGWLRSACWGLDHALARIPIVTLAADVRLLVFEKR
jgi:ubiquinone/menaquinone biosynthesis C-methylase UbiE